MKTISNTHLISGGNPGVAVAVGASIVTGTAAVIEAGKSLVEFGHNVGEAIYNKVNPNDNLGKMVYIKDDFKQPNWYLPSNQHPNNIHNFNNF